MQKRYPTTPEGMASFLRSLYPRHFLQVMQSVSDVMREPSFRKVLGKDEFNIIDIGSGPAVASLAITDMVIQQLPKSRMLKPLKFNYILNDTSPLCLETAERMLDRYFLRQRTACKSRAVHAEKGKVVCLTEPFPKSFDHIRNVCSEGFCYDFLCAGYLLAPVHGNLDLSRAAHCIASMKQFSHPSGGHFLMLQDKFHGDLARQVSYLVGSKLEKFSSRQRAYASTDTDAVRSYTCFRCQSAF